ncbi:DegT/DnrJ/EryC1/StrS family aminotransferase [Sphingomonas sp.]|uniref:DegT/DnrJ/EryC1/StrS family aminotransferase n=1 Tax=Sphingomonas sp. TaxID=28214 RepID=UPI0035BC834A
MTRLFLSSPHMGGDELPLVQDVFASNWIAPTGPMVTAFEEQLAALTGIAHVAALASGTAALHLALRLAGVGAGDEVWCPTMTFIGGVAPICYMGATPVFLDIDEDTLLLDLDLFEHALDAAQAAGKLPRAVITTDLYGHVVDAARMAALRERYGFVWISDAAEAVGARRSGVHAGKGADFAVLSFNGNKIITTSGGGALASDDGEAIERARFLSTQARDAAPHYQHSVFGYNYRLSNVCAAIGVGQLRVLDERVAARRRINARYRMTLGDIDGIRFSGEPEGMTANRWLTTVLIDPERTGFDRETVRLALEAEDMESRPLWKPMHMQPLFETARIVGGAIAERAFAIGLCLPSGSQMTDADVDRVAARVRALVR